VKNHKWRLNKYETLLVPADCEEYQVIPNGQFKMLKAWVD
jgi:hypothetical protein